MIAVATHRSIQVSVDLVALVKPRIMVMALLTAAGGMSLAPGGASTAAVLTMLVGSGLLVGAANALNMYLERDIDCLMARTRNRPLPQGRLAPIVALVFGLASAAAALPILYSIDVLTGALGTLALFSYVLLYTPLKQRTHWATWIGAVPGAMPALMGWTAATHSLDLGGVAVFAVLFFWQVPHFYAISLFRQKEYENAGLKTLPSSHGLAATRHAIVIYLVVQVAASLALPALGVTGGWYTLVAGVAGALVLVQGAAGWSSGDARWARRVFLWSVMYLPAIFTAMVLDGRL